jgi:flagellar biosynthesis GTPase FlhF
MKHFAETMPFVQVRELLDQSVEELRDEQGKGPRRRLEDAVEGRILDLYAKLRGFEEETARFQRQQTEEEQRRLAEQQQWTQEEVDARLHYVRSEEERQRILGEVAAALNDEVPENERLTDDQKAAIQEFQTECERGMPKMAMMGGPGVGKT